MDINILSQAAKMKKLIKNRYPAVIFDAKVSGFNMYGKALNKGGKLFITVFRSGSRVRWC